jgi:mannosyltransferase OCH1-like enzyme
MIPKTIHRMWLDKTIMDNDYAPEKYQKYIQSFKTHNPDFRFVFWNMERVMALFDQHPEISQYRELWFKLPHHIQKCDVARYLIMYLNGGIYVDLDFQCYQNLYPLLDRELILVLEPKEHSKIYRDPVDARLYNGFIGSVPGHPFWIDWLDYIKTSLGKTTDVMYTTGPVNFRIFFDGSKYRDTSLVDTCDIMPIYFARWRSYISNDCVSRNNGVRIIRPNYHKNIGNYTDTKWNEGTGWGMEQLLNKTVSTYAQYVIIVGVIIILIMCAYIFFEVL